MLNLLTLLLNWYVVLLQSSDKNGHKRPIYTNMVKPSVNNFELFINFPFRKIILLMQMQSHHQETTSTTKLSSVLRRPHIKTTRWDRWPSSPLWLSLPCDLSHGHLQYLILICLCSVRTKFMCIVRELIMKQLWVYLNYASLPPHVYSSNEGGSGPCLGFDNY